MSQQPRGSYLPHRKRLPNRKPALLLQDRDLEILQTVFELRFLTLSLLGPLFPSDPTKTPAHLRTRAPTRTGTNLARRLAKLFHHGYLDRIRTVRGGELVYGLGAAGAELLRTRQPQLSVPLTDWAEKNRDLSQLYIDHALMTARFRVALTVALRETPTTQLECFERESRSLMSEWQHAGRRAYVNPDAFFILRDTARPEGRQRSAFFLESDRSTMALSRLQTKFANYSRMYADRVHQERYGVPNFRVVTVAKSAERASNLLKLLLDEDSPIPSPHRAFFLFSTEETYCDHLANVLAATWRSADDPQTLRSLIPSPLPRRPEKE
jgi:hypothetical protein